MQAGRELDELVAKYVFGLEDIWQPFMPSTNIHDAWTVVEKFHEYGGCEIGCYNSRTARWYTVSLIKGNEVVEVTRPTAPHAICIAALKAEGVDIEKAE